MASTLFHASMFLQVFQYVPTLHKYYYSAHFFSFFVLVRRIVHQLNIFLFIVINELISRGESHSSFSFPLAGSTVLMSLQCTLHIRLYISTPLFNSPKTLRTPQDIAKL